MNEEDYVYQRFVEEWERADGAADQRARAVHLSLAEAYLDRFESIAGRVATRFRRR